MTMGRRETEHRLGDLGSFGCDGCAWNGGMRSGGDFLWFLVRLRSIGEDDGLRGLRAGDVELPAVVLDGGVERGLSGQPHRPVLPCSVVSDTDCQGQGPLEVDLRERDGCSRFEPALLVGIDPFVDPLLEDVKLALRCAPTDLHLQVLGHVRGPTSIIDEFVDEHRVEVVLRERDEHANAKLRQRGDAQFETHPTE